MLRVSMICMTAVIITIIIILTSMPVSASLSSSSPSASFSSASSNAAESPSNENAKSMSQLSRLQVAVQLQMQIEQLEKTQTEQLKTPVDAESKTLTDSSEEKKENVTPSNEAPSVAFEGLPIDSTVWPSSLTITSPSSFPSRLILTYWHPISSSWDWLFYSSLDEYSNGFWIDRTDYCGEALLNNNALFKSKLNEEKREKLEEDQEENEAEKMEWNVAELYEPSVDGKEKCVVILPQTENGKSYVLYLISWMTKSWSAWSTPIVFAG